MRKPLPSFVGYVVWNKRKYNIVFHKKSYVVERLVYWQNFCDFLHKDQMFLGIFIIVLEESNYSIYSNRILAKITLPFCFGLLRFSPEFKILENFRIKHLCIRIKHNVKISNQSLKKHLFLNLPGFLVDEIFYHKNTLVIKFIVVSKFGSNQWRKFCIETQFQHY